MLQNYPTRRWKRNGRGYNRDVPWVALRGYPRGITWIALPASVGKSEGLVMPRTEWHGEAFYWGKVQPVHAWKKGL